mmetsp:Transcript_14821/g.24519  ORF Transcript_14821/g.24519 Transcript_14821/m.24519 type:complete len:162 (+) Transcript_14821:131-616(+)
MEIVIEAQRTWCSFLLVAALLLVGYQIIFIVTTVLITTLRFFWAWNQILRLRRPAPVLQSAVYRFVYRQRSKKSSPDDDTCPICLSGYDDGDIVSRGNACVHTFHSECLQCWIKRDPSCPCCRQNIMVDLDADEDDSVASTESWTRILDYLKESMNMMSIS